MKRIDLGNGVVAFEPEEADHIRNVDPNELLKRNWPPEVVENVRRYQKRSLELKADTPDSGAKPNTPSP